MRECDAQLNLVLRKWAPSSSDENCRQYRNQVKGTLPFFVPHQNAKLINVLNKHFVKLYCKITFASQVL